MCCTEVVDCEVLGRYFWNKIIHLQDICLIKCASGRGIQGELTSYNITIIIIACVALILRKFWWSLLTTFLKWQSVEGLIYVTKIFNLCKLLSQNQSGLSLVLDSRQVGVCLISYRKRTYLILIIHCCVHGIRIPDLRKGERYQWRYCEILEGLLKGEHCPAGGNKLMMKLQP